VKKSPIPLDSPEIFLNRELSWLAFASRVIALAESPDLPLLERIKFASIVGMLHDEFFMKRMSGLMRQTRKGSTNLSLDGRQPPEELAACREEIHAQMARLAHLVDEEIRPALAREGHPVLNHEDLDRRQTDTVRDYFRKSVQPILTPLAVDSEHPFPFVSNLGVNLAILLPNREGSRSRFVRIKVPRNRPRWIPVPGGGWIPLEQVIAANLDLIIPAKRPKEIHLFRVTRGAEGDVERTEDLPETDALPEPGSILRQVSGELKARRFAGVVRLQVGSGMPKRFRKWLAKQLGVGATDTYPCRTLLGLCDLAQLEVEGREDLRLPVHEPITHPRCRRFRTDEPSAIFEEISHGEILLHHPYHGFDTSVLRLIQAAAEDPSALAIKLTIYRTSADSPIIRALAEAARRGKQVAVLVEVTARFDEAPNIAWGQYLEKEGVHVAYGVESLKTHVKLALVVREEGGHIRRYCHVGTGNYHTGTARLYEDVGVLTADPEICDEVAMVFNALTGATPIQEPSRLLVAPITMRKRFTAMIRREAKHAGAGRPCGIDAKMNQLQDPDIIRELYRAGRASVPIRLNVRGLCCLRPGVPGLSESIRVFGAVGRFLEHSRIFRFENGGEPEYFLGSADWMRRNLDHRVETVVPVLDPNSKRELDEILDVYERDNCTVWDSDAEGNYRRREPREGETPRAAQETLIAMARRRPEGTPPASPLPRRVHPLQPARGPGSRSRRPDRRTP
jgi:polyphosphate kinase